MSHELLAQLAAAVALAGLAAYAVLAGADFGGGVWDLLATGPRRREQRDAIAHAMGPVWEANHVWLIFVLVVLFTCFPRAYAALSVALFVPFHLALVGIMLRGAAFVFRAYGARPRAAESPQRRGRLRGLFTHPVPWQVVFGSASIISPFLLGAAFGTVTAGGVRVTDAGRVSIESAAPVHWLGAYSVGCGLLALSACAYLAAVYLVVETGGELREDFRRRAIIAGTTTAALAAAVLVLAYRDAPWFFGRLVSARSAPVLAAGLVAFAASAWAVFRRRYRLSRVFAAGEIVLLLLGWGLAHRPYLLYPDLTLAQAAAPAATIRFLLLSLPFGLLILLPSLWLLFAVFKSKPAGADGVR